MNATHISPFRPMADIVSPGQRPTAKVEHFTVSDEDSRFTRIRAACGRPDEYVPAGRYAKLVVNNQLVMSDTRMEQYSNLRPVLETKHRKDCTVLVGGLGLGMVVTGLLANRDVAHVTVIEQNWDVIQLVAHAMHALPNAAGRLTIIHDDILTWTPPARTKYDVIYFDVWADICSDNLPQINALHRRFAKRKKAGGWMGSWQHDRLRRER